MSKFKKIFVVFYFAIAFICIVMLVCFNPITAFATEHGTCLEETDEEENGIVTYGVFTSISLRIDCGNSKVWATAKNDFTLFPSKVYVSIMLYSSYTFTEDYREMTLESSNAIGDLNIGKSITTESPTGGATKYWLARIRYKIDNGSWKEKTVGSILINAAGELT